jgi:two-component system nitrogen regulation response regulator GlnG
MPKVLIADDESSIRTILARTVEKKHLECMRVESGKQALEILTTEPIDVAFIDIRMPEMSGLEILDYQHAFVKKTQIIIMTAQDTMENAVGAMKRGAFDYVTKPFDIEEVGILIDRALENCRVLEELARLKTGEAQVQIKTSLVGRTRVMQEIFKTIGRVANQDVTVLIQGESGTGKELVARALHFQGARAEKPFVAVNCSAIPHDLLESELFGHRKGSFTGAVEDKVGFLERANHGTIFLDEISEMPQSLQAKLLRFLQDKSIQRVGDSTIKTLDVRVIAATNRRLDEDVRKGAFREDLYFRLNVVPVKLPALRERREDIPLLVDFFLRKYGKELLHEEKQFSADAMEYLTNAGWPGNVRQLENTIKRSLVLCQSAIITKGEIDRILSEQGFDLGDSGLESLDLESIIERKLSAALSQMAPDQMINLYEKFLPIFERPLLKLVMEKSSNNQLQAAHVLGINRNTLRKRLRELGLKAE